MLPGVCVCMCVCAQEYMHCAQALCTPGGCLLVWGTGLHPLGTSRCCDLEPQVCLTLAVPARVARGTVAVAGADVEMPVVPAAHAARVPGDLWPDKEGNLEGGLQAGASWVRRPRAPGTTPQDAAALLSSSDQALIHPLPRRRQATWTLTTESPCMVPSFEAARDTGRAE